MTDVIKNNTNYYIMRRALIPETFEDAKPELLASHRNNPLTPSRALASRAEARLRRPKIILR